MSAGPSIIRRGPSHDTLWKSWSTGEAQRLSNLPSAELLLAVQTGATIDLTGEDQGRVFAILAASGFGHGGPAPANSSRPKRRPLPFKGAGLPCGARPIVRPHRIRIGLALALVVVTWGAGIALGYPDLAPHMVDAP